MTRFQTDLLDLRLGDCMDLMRDTPDGFYDLALVDPPYGYGGVIVTGKSRREGFGGFIDHYEIQAAVIDSNQRSQTRVDVVHHGSSKETIRSFGEVNVSPPPEYFNELFRVSKNQIIWGGNYFILPPSRGFLIWKKTTVHETFSMAMCEYAWMSYNANAKVWEGAPQGSKADPRIHPTQKPVKLYDWILANYAKPGQRILDTHLGSGSHAIACHYFGAHLTATEIDPDYFAAAVERIQRETQQIELFPTAPQHPTHEEIPLL
jgi:site-specific DNA-methyltransferase (adenine-specific)